MKTLITIFAATFLLSAYGQSSIKLVKSRVDNREILMNWKVGQVKEVNNVKISRLAGENSIEQRTNVFYIPVGKLLADINQKAEMDPLYKMECNKLMDHYTKDFPGGKVALFYDRASQALADPRYFTVIVQNEKTGEIIHEEKLDYQQPYSYKWGIWYYYKTIDIPKEVGEKFIIRILDEGLQRSFEFLVYDNFPVVHPSVSKILVAK